MPPLRTAVFLDRDGVLVADNGFLLRADQICLLPGVPQALQRLKSAEMLLVVASNQAVVARGLIDEEVLVGLNGLILDQIEQAGGPRLDAVYYCPHHPEATLPGFRTVCQCRKPRPGMMLSAAREYGIDLAASFLVGDRPTDIMAGRTAGCRTILVTCGRHDAPPIVTVDPPDADPRPDHICPDLPAATEWILSQST